MKVLRAIGVKQFSADKILNHPERIAGWLRTGTTFPVTYEFDLTNRCNNNCPYCFGYERRERNLCSLTPAFIRRVLPQVARGGGRAVTFTGGGEPLLHPYFGEAVILARRLGLDVGVISNGLALDDATARVILRHATWVRISIDAATARTYRATHGLPVAAFRRVLENTRRLAALKRRLRSRTTVGVGFLTSRETMHEIGAFARLGCGLGVDYVQYRPLLTPAEDRYVDQHAAHARTIIRRILQARQRHQRQGCDVLFSQHKYEVVAAGETRRGYGICHGHHFATVIAADGKMYVCCHMRGRKKYCLGDLSRQTLRRIWLGAERRRACRRIDFADCPELCRCDSFNTILWQIAAPKEHVNFL